MSRHLNSQTGMTLIEILVTVLIMSIGLLGLAGLQSTAIKDGMDVATRSQALFLATELAERMHANPGGATDYIGTLSNCGAAPSNCSDTSSDTDGGSYCSTSELAAYDTWEVFCGQTPPSSDVMSSSAGSLNLEQVSISCRDGNCTGADDVYIVEISWIAEPVDNSTLLSDSAKNAHQISRIRIPVRP